MGKSTISMAIFNSYVSLPEGNLRFTNTTLWMFKWHDVGYFHKTAHSFWLSSSRKPRLLKYLDISNWTINIPDIDSNMVHPTVVLLNPTAPFFLWFSIVKIMGSSWFRWIKLGEAYGQVCDIKKVLQLWVPRMAKKWPLNSGDALWIWGVAYLQTNSNTHRIHVWYIW